MSSSMGYQFKQLVSTHSPLSIVGTINAYCALLAEQAGCRAIYLSGAGVANANFGLPDLGMTSLTEVAEAARHITARSSLPLLVDVDTGWGHYFNVQRTVREMERAFVAAIHIEDQKTEKRCGHRPNKGIVSMAAMNDRLKAAVDARHDPDFVIMARTDAFATEGISGVIDRAQSYVETGADMIFIEAMSSLEDYATITRALSKPVLANMTEFGKTPLMTREALQSVGVQLILYPLSAFRAMSFAALNIYTAIEQEGTQANQLQTMQTREALYDVLDYWSFEKTMDTLKESQDE